MAISKIVKRVNKIRKLLIKKTVSTSNGDFKLILEIKR